MSVYPFRGTLADASGTPILGNILKINSTGFLIQVEVPVGWKVGHQARVQFTLPLAEKFFDSPVKVVKAYLGLNQTPGMAKEKLQIFEMHFLGLAPHKKSVIDQFIAQAQAETGDKTGS